MTIVVDTNVISHLHLPSEHSSLCELVASIDAEWVAPLRWRSELRNVLALYLRKDLLEFETATGIQSAAEELMSGGEYEINSRDVLELARNSGCSAYDCEFVALARALGVLLVTADRKLARAFPDLALSPAGFIERRGAV